MLSKKHLLLMMWLFVGAVTPLLAQDLEEGDEIEVEIEDDGDVDIDVIDSDGEVKTLEDYPFPHYTTQEYSDYVTNGRQDQQDRFLDREYNFPARPKDKWEIGITFGPLLISGDVKTGLGDLTMGDEFHWKAGIGGHIRKSFGYVFSLRGNFMMGSTWGRNWQAANGWSVSSINGAQYAPNKALRGSTLYDQYNEDFDTPNYLRPNPGNGEPLGYDVFYNYKTEIRELSLSGIVNLHNIRFHKRQNCLNLYGLFGIGGVAYRTYMDMLDENGEEYIEQFNAITTNYGLYENRDEVLEQLDEIYDGTFESQAERHFDDSSPFDDYSYKPTAHVGIGLGFKVTRWFNLGLESRVTYTNDDLLDGQRWQEWGALTRDYDTYVYTGLNANFNIGPKNSVEPLWWMNPLDYAYAELNEAPCCDDLDLPDLADDDNDGVANVFDVEPDSREGCPVDTKGRMLDSDRDGILDCDDQCPHSPPYDIFGNAVEIDENGCAPAVELSCEMFPDLCKCVDKCRPATPVVTPHVPSICDNPVFPNILFDLNKYSVKPEFQAQLAEVARILNQCPHLNLCVIGHTDVRASNPYNDVLSYKRATEVVNLLVSQYGVPRSRLTVQYRGENNPAIGGLNDRGTAKGLDSDHALNRRVEFRVCPPGMDMSMPAGPSNAGSRKPKP